MRHGFHDAQYRTVLIYLLLVLGIMMEHFVFFMMILNMHLHKIFLKKKWLLEEYEEWYFEYKIERNRELCQDQYYKNREKRIAQVKAKRDQKVLDNIQERRKLTI